MLDIADMVHEHVTTERKSTSLHPSALGGCPRAQMLRLNEARVTHPRSKSLLWDFESFGWHEQPFVSTFSAGRCLIGAQVELKFGPWHGYVDTVITADGEPDELGELQNGVAMVEVKSLNPGAFKYRHGKAYPHHIEQTNCYWIMATQGELPIRCLTRSYIAYIERWDKERGKVPRIFQVDVTPTEKELERTLKKMLQLEEMTNHGTLPDTPWNHPEEHPFYCTGAKKGQPKRVRCPYFGHCWADYEAQYTPQDELPF